MADTDFQRAIVHRANPDEITKAQAYSDAALRRLRELSGKPRYPPVD